MKLVVFSHKECWRAANSPTGFATDGGFPFQMSALAELFDETTIVVPCLPGPAQGGLTPLSGHNLSIAAVTPPFGRGIWRKLGLLPWLVSNSPTFISQILSADAVHAPIPGDIGTIGMILACILRKPLFVRHCGNWLVQKTTAEHFWKWFMERFAGGRNVMLATGGQPEPPSRNKNIRWIFSTSLTAEQIQSSYVRRDRLNPARARLVIACRQDREKGTGVVIESLPEILKDFPETTLDVMGNGPALEEFKKKSESLGVADRVTFHGKLDHATVMKRLQSADLFCYPTRASEGFPKVVLEALACGLPVVSTGVSVIPQLIAGGGGVLINEATPVAVAEGVRQCLRDPEKYRIMSARALETATQFSLERWRTEIGQMLRKAWNTNAN